MIKKGVNAAARRAQNIVWNAAGSYDFEPPFLAFYPNGKSDSYFNLVIGLTAKYYDLSRVVAFFTSYSSSAKAEEFDEFLWLGIENAVYERELPDRPILTSLRRKRAAEFFEVLPTLSRQQMMYSSMPVFTQQEARWAAVLGRPQPIMSRREKDMAEALRFKGTEDLIRQMTDFLRIFFHYDVSTGRQQGAGPSIARALAGKVLRHEGRRRDVLFLRTGTGMGDRDRSVSLEHFGTAAKVQAPDAADAAYISACFGEAALPESRLLSLERDLCTGAESACRLWVARGGYGQAAANAAGIQGREAAKKWAAGETAGKQISRSSEELAEKRAVQIGRNKAYLAENARLIKGQITRLAGQLATAFESWARPLPERAATGSLIAGEAWKMDRLGRPDVFVKKGDEAEKDIALTLLIDASMSRVNLQERIAAEADVIAESLVTAGVPVQVAAFRSLRGYTVLELLKDFGDRKCDGIANFYAGGWNRDSLGISATGALIRDARDRDGRRHLLFVLTDGNPNDSTPIAMTGRLRPVEYQGPEAVQLTKEAVSGLRQSGIRTGAIFCGATYHLETINRIYGQDYVRIQKVEQLSGAVTELLLRELRKMDIRE